MEAMKMKINTYVNRNLLYSGPSCFIQYAQADGIYKPENC